MALQKTRYVFALFSSLLLWPLSFAEAKEERWLIATLEWPPFICSKCPDNGAAGAALRKVLKSEKIIVEYAFYPFVHARKISNTPKFIGYYPAWREELLEGFELSAPLFSSPLIFLENRKKPLVWKKLSDLKGKKFAVTSGYGNTGEFNKLADDKLIFIEEYLDDDVPLKRLNEGAVDGVLMDYNVAQYYLNEIYPQYKKNIEINPRIIEKKDLYLVFNSFSKAQRHRFKKILEKYNFAREVDDYFTKK